MVRLLWLFIMAATLYWAVRELFANGSRGVGGSGAEGEEMVQDPECGVYLPKSSAVSTGRSGRKRYFCSVECKNKFFDRAKG